MECSWITLALLHCVVDIHSVFSIHRSLVPPASILLLLAMFPGSGRVTSGQRLPSRDEEHFLYQLRHKEVFYDTRRLPDGKEMKVFLPKNDTQRFYFLIKEERSPLSFTITPCTLRPIQWRLLYQEYPTTSFRQRSRPDSVDELLRQGYDESQHSNHGYRYIILDTFLVGSRTKYTIGETISGLFTLEFTSVKGDASLQIFGTSFPEHDPHPVLPRDSHVTASQNADRSVTLSWKRSPSDGVHSQDVEYCVSVGLDYDIPTHCGAVAYAEGDSSSVPPHVGFGFPWEKKYGNITIARGPGPISYSCVGQKTTYTLSTLSSGLRYFVGVYVVDRRLNTSAAYTGRTLKIKARRAKPLKDGKVRTSLASPSSPAYFRLHRERNSGAAYVMVDACSRPIKVTLSRNGRILDRTAAAENGYVSFGYSNTKKGTYLVMVNAIRRRTLVKVWYTTDSSSYPSLPADSNLYVDSDNTTCRSATVSWYTGSEKQRRHDENQRQQQQQQQYCVYVQKIAEGGRKETHDNKGCVVHRRLPKSGHLIRCIQLHAGHVTGVHSETIEELQPDSVYAVALYTTKHSRQWLSYKTAYFSTRASC